jgi:hypothetical protein
MTYFLMVITLAVLPISFGLVLKRKKIPKFKTKFGILTDGLTKTSKFSELNTFFELFQ